MKNIQPGDRILFIGDSLTDAFRRPDELNPALQLGSGYVLLAAAQLSLDRPADHLDFLNRGVSGDTVSRMMERWQSDCIDLKPTFVSILVGVNDTLFGAPYEETAASYRDILKLCADQLPETRLLVLEPFLLRAGTISQAQCQDLAARCRVIRSACSECGLKTISLQDAFDSVLALAPAEYWAYDGIHATAAGAAVIARSWLSAATGG